MNPSISPLRQPAGALHSRRPLRASSQLLALEQRFMFDGADAAHAAQAAHDSAPPPVPPAVQVRAAEPAKDQGKKEVAIVDTSLANYKSLEAGVRDGVGIIEFDGSRDGLAQIAQWAASQSGLDAIHVLSHGSQGTVNFGSMLLTEASLASSTTQAELAQLGQALTADGDLLLYGCDVAAGDGAQLLAGIAKATGADVAASTDTTGAARLDGNWTLEAHDGTIDARALALTQYDGALTTVPFVYGSDGDDVTPVETITKSVSGKTITFSGPEMYIYNYGAPDDGLYPYAADGGDGVRLTITVQAGYSFDISSFGAQSDAGSVTFNITWADGTVTTYIQGGVNNSGVISTLSSFNTALNDMRSITITSANYSTFQNFDITDIKLLPPTARVDGASLGSDTGSSNSDFITSTASQTISGTLSADLGAGERVQVSYDNGDTWSDATSYAEGSSAWSTTTTLAGSSTFIARVTNSDAFSTAYSHAYTLDTSAPTTTFSGISLSADTGTSSSDFITKTASQTITATLSNAPVGGDIVWGSLDGGSTWTDITTKVSGTTLSWNGATLNAGTSAIMLKVTDAAGNDSSLSFQNYTLDTTSPTTSMATAAFSSDSGASSTDFITNVAAQTISGTLSANLASSEKVYVSLDNGGTWIAATAATGQATWTLGGVTLAASSTLQVKVSDAAGNQSDARSQAYTLDTSPPATPGRPALATNSDTGSFNNDGITYDSTPTFSGTAEDGSTVTLYDGATMLGTVIAGIGGWTYTPGILGNGSHTITATATDKAGNVSAASAGLAITIDTAAPAVTSVAVPANGIYNNGSVLDFTVNFNEAVTVDSFGGTPRIAIVVGATTRYAEYVSGSGSSTLVFRYTVLSGDMDVDGITVGALSPNGGTIQDIAGNDAVTTLNSVGGTAGVAVDGSQPSITNVSASTADGAYGGGQTITITVDFSSAVTVDTSGGAPTLALEGGGSATYTGGSGSATLTFTYTVGAGQNSADLDYSSASALALNGATITNAGGSHQAVSVTLFTPGTAGSLGANKDIVIDTAAPTNTVAGAAFSADTGSSGSDFITNTAAQTISGTLASNLAAGENVYVSLDDGSTWTLASASVGANTWSLAGQTLSGSGTLRVRVSDNAGNNGTAYVQAYVLDTTAPTTSFSGVALSADTGMAGDLVTNTAAQTISATLSAAPAAGDVVYGSLDNGATWTDITSKVSGTTLTWNGVTLMGSDTLMLRVTDAAGNNGAATSRAYVLDTTAPSTNVVTVAFSNDSGASPTDFITNVAAQTISGTLSANLAAGETVYVSLDNGATWGAATSAAGTNTWSLAGQTLTASNTLQVKVSDAAGNDGPVLSQAYVLDTTGPAIGVANLALSADTGTSSSDFITNAASQTITATLTSAPASGDTVWGSLDGGSTWIDITSKVSGTTLTWNDATLNAGTSAIVFKVTDDLGNDSALSSRNYTLDTTAPSASVATAVFSNDSGASSTDFITNVAAQTISGTLSANLASGETVYVSLDNGATWAAATSVAGTNTWSLAGQTLTASGTLRVKVSDAAGNEGVAIGRQYTLDTTAPTTTASSATRADNGNVSGLLSAPLAAGESVAVSLDGGATWVPASIGAGGTTWSIANAGTGVLQVQVFDTAGNASAPLRVDAIAAPVQPLPPPVRPALPAEALPWEAHDALSSDAPPVPPVLGEIMPPWQSSHWAGSLDNSLFALDFSVLSGSFDSLGARGGQAAHAPVLTRPAADGAFQVLVRPELRGNGVSLIANRPITDFDAHSGDYFSLQLPFDTFAHTDEYAMIELSARSLDGTPLPRWLKFDARTARFEGTPPIAFEGTLNVKVVARDAQGHEAVEVFKVTVTKDASAKGAHAEGRLRFAESAGRASLSDQLRAARGAAADRLAALPRNAAAAGLET